MYVPLSDISNLRALAEGELRNELVIKYVLAHRLDASDLFFGDVFIKLCCFIKFFLRFVVTKPNN